MLWLARSGTTDQQYAAYDILIEKVKYPSSRATIIAGDESKLVDVKEMISGLPLHERYGDKVEEAAKKMGFDKSSFVIAVLFRHTEEAATVDPDVEPLRFIGKFEFSFPQRGDFVGRDDQEWLGINEAYCLDQAPNQPKHGHLPPPNFVERLKNLFGRKKNG